MENSTKDTKETEDKLTNKDEEALSIDSQIAKEHLNQLASTEQGCRCGGACKKRDNKHTGKECNHQAYKD